MNAAAARRPAPALRLVSDASDEGQDTVNELEQALTARYRFTARERDVLGGLVGGVNDEAIARALGLRITTVHKLMHGVFGRTGTEDRQGLIKLGFRLAARRRIFAPSLMAA